MDKHDKVVLILFFCVFFLCGAAVAISALWAEAYKATHATAKEKP